MPFDMTFREDWGDEVVGVLGYADAGVEGDLNFEGTGYCCGEGVFEQERTRVVVQLVGVFAKEAES
jgi:hypothetical protein